ncbi:FAD-dependent oxidoreductase [Pseudaminobacter arsenicus]|uniref:FAD-dependent oxidoreductase n=1 Tax=Borborobacter arsenicus TaxID=1851146 RepID=A0A432V0I2_9HYPH|nr:FAD-dependent oxidoreductase [Pseudaminobacter arsenicus]RUM95608.1 FAD-dependent oxidoreductase [Pseudaminobacter arsenicus]
MLQEFRAATQLSHDPEIVIVGAGAVGLTLAVHLARTGKRVLLLEAGDRNPSPESQAIFKSATCTGHNLTGLHEARSRALGGTTNLWGGQLLKFDPIVFGKREWLPDSEWPISANELESDYELAFDLLGMRCRLDDCAVWKQLKVSPPDTGTDLDFFFTRWAPETNFARLFERDLLALTQLEVLTRAPVTGLWSDESGKNIGVVITGTNGTRHRLSAGKVILAHGTIEIARLLSIPFTDDRVAPWTDNRWVGRGFCDHVDVYAGAVTPINVKRFQQLFDAAVLRGLKYLPKLKLSESAQHARKLLGIAAHFVSDTENGQELKALKAFARSLLNGKPDVRMLEDTRQIVSLAKTALPLVTRYLRHRRIYNPTGHRIQLRLTTEQIALPTSGLRLGNETDALGMPIVEMDWQVDGAELATMIEFGNEVATFLQREGLAKVTLNPLLVDKDPAFLTQIDDGYHQMGMARMGWSARDGVVDSNLKVFGTNNLFIAGAATFRSTGFANPTLTAVALALRLSRAIQNGLV